ncbi:MAG TPA: hypothetical protein VKU39_02050 [Streptosporangiaceae bacterium]|nr:hypothetical protein [Streptosporangiaceae bacterium]
MSAIAATFHCDFPARMLSTEAFTSPAASTLDRGIRKAAANRLASASAVGRADATWCSPCSTRCPSSCAASNLPRSPVLPVLRNTNGFQSQ